METECPPSGWSGSPSLGNSDSWYCETNGPQLMAINNNGTGEWDLFSPLWDMSSYNHVILSFDHILDGHYDAVTGSCEAQILLEYSGQPPYLYWHSTDNITSLTNVILDISDEVAGKSDVKITFRFSDTTNAVNGNWGVDNIKVVGY